MALEKIRPKDLTEQTEGISEASSIPFDNGDEVLRAELTDLRHALLFSVKDTKFGATGDGTTDDSAAVTDAIATVPAGTQIYFPEGTYILDAIVVNRDVGFKLHPKAILKHKANATGNMISYTAPCTGVFEGGTLDGNKDNQVLTGASHTRYACLQTYGDGMVVRDLTIQNYCLAGIDDLNTRTRIFFERIKFVDGAEHGGEYRSSGRGTEQSSAVLVSITTANVNPHFYFTDCHVWQTDDPSETGVAPGGFILAGVRSTNTLVTGIVKNCTFKKIGQTFPRSGDANHIGCVDFYEGTVNCQVTGCTFKENKYTSIKCNNSFAADISHNYFDEMDSGILEADGAALILVDVIRTLGDASTDYGHTIIANNRLFDAGNCACIRIAGRGTDSDDEIPDISLNGNRCKNSTGRALQIANAAGRIEINGGVYIGSGPGASNGAVEVQNLDAAGEVYFNNVKIKANAFNGLVANSGVSGSIYITGGKISNGGSGTTALIALVSARLHLEGVTLDGTSGNAYVIQGANIMRWNNVPVVAGSRSVTWGSIAAAEGTLEGDGEPGAAGVKAVRGVQYRRLNGGAGSTHYVKEGIAGSVADTTSWAAK